jgi:hypothetical protein
MLNGDHNPEIRVFQSGATLRVRTMDLGRRENDTSWSSEGDGDSSHARITAAARFHRCYSCATRAGLTAADREITRGRDRIAVTGGENGERRRVGFGRG